MRRRIIWIAILTTMTSWLGCAGSGGDQNYRILNEDPPMFQTDPAPPQSAAPFSLIQAARADDQSSEEPEEAPLGPSTRPTEPGVPLTKLAAPPVPSSTATEARFMVKSRFVSDGAPSLNGLDRSRWPKIVFEVQSGRNQHGPLLFHDSITHADRFPTVRDSAPTEIQLRTSLANPWAEDWDVHNARDEVVQTFKYAFDYVTAPVHAVCTEPLWEPAFTPPLRAIDKARNTDFTMIPTNRWPIVPGDALPQPRPTRAQASQSAPATQPAATPAPKM